jgi:predicted phosphodiesterase
MKLKILHLSDFHFKTDNVSQDIVLSSLSKQIQTICNTEDKPNMLIITGDIAFSGKTEEYLLAKEFINKVAQYCNINIDNIFIIPGNHDVDRKKIGKGQIDWWYNFKDDSALIDVLSSDQSFPIIKSKTDAYYEFLKEFMSGKTEIGKYGEYVTQLPFGNGGLSLKIIGLNSSIFCGYDGDDQKKLALGLPQVTKCGDQIDNLSEIIITCVHHPFDCFHTCEKPSLAVIQRFSDIILSGHVHEANNSFHQGGNTGDTIFITSGSAYEYRTTQNGFNIIEIDSDTLKGNVIFYKYISAEHNWIRNKDINHANDGVFPFEIKKGTNIKKQESMIDPEISVDNNSTYMFVLNGKFDELDREKFKAFETHLKTLFKDVNGTIVKVEKSSIKIYFETSNEITSEMQSELKKIYGLDLLEFKKTNDNLKNDKSVFHWKTTLKPEYSKTLENPGASFTHSRAEDDLTLKDLYVSPNLKIISLGENVKDKIDKVVGADKALTKVTGTPMKIVIYGADSSGKSTLMRWWYDKYYELGYIPVLIEGNSIKDISIDKIKKLVEHEIKNQYNGVFQGKLEEFEQDRIVLLIDDFHKIRFSKSKFKTNLISNIDQSFSNVIITGNDLMQFESYSSKSGGNVLEDFHKYSITEFGPKLRYELIKKWNEIGMDQLDSNELIRLNNETESHVESIIGKNFVPSFPLYILTILQAREATSAQKPEFSIHGFYYELLINDALNKAVKNKADISLYYNFITDYCYFLFDSKIRLQPLFIDDFLKFHKQYCDDYKIEISPKVVIETLVNSKLLKVNIDTISVSYKYVYYFFVARFLANHISQDDIKNKIKLLCQRVHRDEFASIVMFLTHLTKDQFVLNQLLENSKELFKEFAPLKLEEDVSFINNLILKLPEQVYLPMDINKMKEEELKEKEELDIQEKQFDAEKDIFDYDLDEDINTLDVLSTMIKAIKSIEILGQVTKKYWGELKAPQKFELAEETYMLGLRTLGFYFSLVGKDTEMLVEYLNHIYKKKNLNKNISKEDVDKASRNFLFGLCAMSTFGIIKSITNAIGYEKLSGTFEDILTNHNFNSVKLIDTSIKLDHNKSFPWENIKTLKPETDKNYLASIVLKNLVINYMYVFITSESDKQKLCELLDIKMEQLRMIDATSTVKKETPR